MGRIVKSFEEFISESIWSDIQDRSSGETIRKEDKNIIGVLDDGTKLRAPVDAINGVGELIKFDDGKKYYTLYDGFYLAVVNENGNDIYYLYDPDTEEDYNMIEFARFKGDTFRTEYEFAHLRAVIKSAVEDDGIIPADIIDGFNAFFRDNGSVDIETSNYDYLVFEDHDAAVSYAAEDASEIEIESLKSILNTKDIQKRTKDLNDFIEHIRNFCGNDVFDEDELKDIFKETFDFDFDDYGEEDAIDSLLELEIIEDSEDYFDLDEDGDIDHSSPKFNYQDYRDQYVEKMLDDISDFVEEYIYRFGCDGIEKYIDFDKVGKEYVDIDGPAHWLASYDDVEREVEIDGTTYYIYRRN